MVWFSKKVLNILKCKKLISSKCLLALSENIFFILSFNIFVEPFRLEKIKKKYLSLIRGLNVSSQTNISETWLKMLAKGQIY